MTSIPYAIPKRGSARFARALARSWFSPYPVDVWKCRVPALQDHVQKVLDAGSDLCVADFLVAEPNVPRPTPVPLVLFEHNVEHMIWKRLHELEPSAWRRALLALEWRKMRHYEARACARADLTIAVSEADRVLLQSRAPGARIRAVATGVDTAYFSPNGSGELPTRLVFSGSMDWYPNEDAVLHFVDAILPTIRREVPNVSVTVAGRNPSERLIAAAATAGVDLTGTVPDIRPYIAEATVYIVPLRVGGGTRLKIFEALAMGKAVVSTTVGAEGLPVVSGEHIVRADDPDDFAQAVTGLLREPGRRRTLGAAGRRLVQERYSWAQVAREFESLCTKVLPSHAR